MNPRYEVAQVLERNAFHLEHYGYNTWQLRTLHAIRKCRTAAMGGHIDCCDNPSCHAIHISYNSCRNRHCPKCQGHKQELWIRSREAELLPVPYFHVVFTLPSQLNALSLSDPKTLYNMLFKTAWEVIKGFGSNPKNIGAQMAMIAILHSWGQNMALHPHLHCIVPGGGISKSGKWKSARAKGKYLFCVKAMSVVFRAKFVAHLRSAFDLPQSFYDALFAKSWVVYCKLQFYGPAQVIEYLGRYTHKIAVSNHRIKSIDQGKVHFSAKDYRRGGKKHHIALDDTEFIRRFTIHILPKGFVRIRHFGFLSSRHKKQILANLQMDIGIIKATPKPDILLNKCQKCEIGNRIVIHVFDGRGPPKTLLNKLKLLHIN
jgi:hypothetical protein